MKTIKFRGVTKSGDTITGDLTHSTITGLPKIWVNGSAVSVDPDSVEIFTGYTENGDEAFIKIPAFFSLFNALFSKEV